MNTTIEQNQGTQARPEATARFVSPPVNIFEGKDGYTIEAELPGVGKDGLEVTVEGTELTLVGRRSPAEGRAETLYRESNDLNYRRAFELDPLIDTAKITATIEQGLLTIWLPKSEKAKPQKISVTE